LVGTNGTLITYHAFIDHPGGAQCGALKAHRIGRAYIEATSEVGGRFVRR
jgi:hypothetical protein